MPHPVVLQADMIGALRCARTSLPRAAMLLFMVAASSLPARAQDADALYVAPGGRDDWSGRLASPNPAGTDGPLATLAAAQALMRAGTRGRLTYLRDGSYFLSAPVRIGEADSGVRIAAYPGEHPVLYGGLPVPEWRAGDDGAAGAVMPQVAPGGGLPILIAGGRVLPNARYPLLGPGDDHAEAWLFADRPPDGIDPHRSFAVRAGDAAAFAAIRAGSVITIFGQRGWQNVVFPIQHVDAQTRVITLDGRSWDAMGEGSRFAILNAVTTPGTWRLDTRSGLLHLNAIDATPSGPAIIAATLPCVVAVDHASDIALAGVAVIGSATEGAGVCLTNTQRVTLDALSIANTGDGIRLDHAIATTVTGSEIAHTAGFGIALRRGSDETVVRGNWLHNIGWLHQDASAIWFDASSRNRFSSNRIEDVAKFAIGGGSLTEGGAYDTVIEGNEIVRANLRTSDGGGIMVIGWSQDATRDVIRGNFVSGVTALGNVGWDNKPHTDFQDPVTRLVSQAIYLDDWASDVQVTGNLLCGNIGGMELHAGWDNQVRDNVLVGNAGIALGIDAENWLGAGAHPHAMEGNVIERNTVILDRPSTGQSGVTAVRGGDTAARFDNNIYAGPGLNAYSFHHAPDHLWSDYSFGVDAWRRRGQDTHSRVGSDVAEVVLANGAVRVTGAANPPPPLVLADIGRPQDRAGLEDRVRQRCGLR